MFPPPGPEAKPDEVSWGPQKGKGGSCLAALGVGGVVSSEDSARLQAVKGTWEQGIEGPLGWAGAVLVSGPRGPSRRSSL